MKSRLEYCYGHLLGIIEELLCRFQKVQDNAVAVVTGSNKYDHITSILNDLAAYPDRAPLKEVLGGQYNYREGGGKSCGRALKAAGGEEDVDVIRIRAPKK